MSRQSAQYLADLHRRDVAKSALDTHYANFKADLAERGIGGRIADEATERAKLMFDEAVTIVEEHPAVVGGTLGAILLWFLRNPIIAGFDYLRDRASS